MIIQKNILNDGTRSLDCAIESKYYFVTKVE